MDFKERHELVKRMFKDGKSAEEITEATGYKWNTIKIILNKSGISYATKVKYDYTDVIELKKQGISATEISKMKNIPRTCVIKYLNRRGIVDKVSFAPPVDREENIDIASLPHAKPRMAHIYNDGNKKWVDLTDKIFEQPEIMMMQR